MIRPSPDQPGEDRAAEEQSGHTADNVGDAFRPIAARGEVDSVKRADHDDTERDGKGQAPGYVREQEGTS
jgi:hypothetical protein